MAQVLQKMIPLLAFLFRGGELTACCRDEWLKASMGRARGLLGPLSLHIIAGRVETHCLAVGS